MGAGAEHAIWGSDVVEDVVSGHPCLVYAQRPRWAGHLPLQARRFQGRPHLVQGERRIGFEEHDEAVLRVAARLQDDGVQQRDRVLLLGANEPEWVVAFWAVLRAGAIAVPGNAWWSPGELAHALGTVGPRLVIADDRRRPSLPPGTPVLPFEELPPLLDPASPPSAAPPEVAGDEDDPAVILFTSGTTGLPKGATLSHRSLIANQQSLLTATGRLPTGDGSDRPGPVSLLTVPLFHMGGIQSIITALLTGGTLVFLEGRFDAGEVLRLIQQERVTLWGSVPTMVARVLDHPDLGSRDTSSLRSITMGGAPVTPELVARTRSAFPNARRGVGTIYGLTESGGALTAGVGDALADRPHSVGRPLPVVELRIADPDDRGVGEILARSPTVMNGYWGAPDDPILDGAGWLRTGDVGRIDKDGYLYVLDRTKDVIIRGGENIAGPHVEDRLLAHEAVAEVAVVGLPHPDLGEEVAAAVVLQPGRAVSSDELAAHAAAGLAHFEVPSAWWIRAEPLPVNAVGKVLKRELRASWPDRTDPA